MPNTPQVNFNVSNQITLPNTPTKGVVFVEGITVMGPVNDPKDIITSWSQFKKIFGGYHPTSDFPLLCQYMLDKGVKLRVNRVAHYTDITSAATLTAVKATSNPSQLLTFSAATVTGNVFNCKVNNSPIASVTWATSNDNFLQLIAAAIKATGYVKDAVVLQNTGNATDDRKIFITQLGSTTVTVTDAAITAGASQATVAVTDYVGIPDSDLSGVNAGNTKLFDYKAKYAGVNYNSLVLTVANASNGSTDYFNLTVSLDGTTETYENLKLENVTVANATYFQAININSNLIELIYVDLSAKTTVQKPYRSTYQVMSGSDGGSVVNTDYIGDSSTLTGLHAFDTYSEAYALGVMDNNADAIAVAGEAYAAGRKDLRFYHHLDNTLTTASALIAKRKTLPYSKYIGYFAGGTTITDPITGFSKSISELASIFVNLAATHTTYGEWYSIAGTNRGVINGVTGVVNNFGSPASFADLQLLAQNQINMVINRDGKIMQWGYFSGQVENNAEKFLSINNLVIYVIRTLKPTVESYIEEPTDIPMIRDMYYACKPALAELVTKRACFATEWLGDQNASSTADFQINDPIDFGQGKYKVQLKLTTIAPLQEVLINIVLTTAGITIE